MTAEFAALLPVVVSLLALCVLLVQLAGQQVRLQSAAASAARMLARGETSADAAAQLSSMARGVELEVRDDGQLVCAELSQRQLIGPFHIGSITVRAEGCALLGSGG